MCRGVPEVPLIVPQDLQRTAAQTHIMNYQVIARKWRPQTFAEVVGQQHVTRTLENAIAHRARGARLHFFGRARRGQDHHGANPGQSAQLRQGPHPEPCNECDSCREITAGNSLDVLEIDAASNRGIDQVRELRDMVRYAPAGGRYKVVILDEAHMLTAEASNALLKTLEEPPEKVVFVMATTQPEDLVETIRSRSQHFHFRALSFAEIVEALERHRPEGRTRCRAGALAVMARAADGSLRDALSLLEQARAYCGTTITEAQVRELLGVVPAEVLDELVAAIEDAFGRSARSRLVHRLLAEGQNLQQFCREAIAHFRNLLVARVCGADSDLVAAPAEERPRLARAAAAFSEEDLTRFFQILLLTEEDLRRKPDPRLHLEMGLLRLVNAARLAPLEEVLAELSGQSAPRPAPAKLAEQAAVRASVPHPATPPTAPLQRLHLQQPRHNRRHRSHRQHGQPPSTATDCDRRSRFSATGARAMAAAGIVNGDRHSAGGGTVRAARCPRAMPSAMRERRRIRPAASMPRKWRPSNRRLSLSRNFSANWWITPAAGNSTAAKFVFISHREPRARGAVASPRAHGEVAHHRQPRARPAAARLC